MNSWALFVILAFFAIAIFYTELVGGAPLSELQAKQLLHGMIREFV